VKPLFVGAVGVISSSLAEGRALFVGTIGLPLRRDAGTNFLHTQKLRGSRYFGVWPLSEAAKACFGRERWPKRRAVPQMFIEFEVGSPAHVAEAALELRSKGYDLLHPPRTDPWGQTVARLQTKDGLIIGISYVPWMHRRTTRRGKGTPRTRRGRRASDPPD